MLPILGFGSSQKRKPSYDAEAAWKTTPVSASMHWYDRTTVRYALLAMLGLALFLSVATTVPSAIAVSSSHFRRPSYTPSPPLIDYKHLPTSFEFGMVADLDKQSRVKGDAKPRFESIFQRAILKRHVDGSDGSRSTGELASSYSVTFRESETFSTTLNEAGRGFELSELAWFQGHLHSFDDRTGIIFRLEHFGFNDPAPMAAVPTHIIMEGNGATDKGQKHEWATVKNGELYIGSIGKEFTSDGEIVHEHNMWVAIVGLNGAVRHEDWSHRFAKVRAKLGCAYPGYVIHEAIEWSPVHEKWFLLPRRVSSEPYDDMADEKRGANVMVIASDDFEELSVVYIGDGVIARERGFSSFKFVPGTKDAVIIALKSMENEALQLQGAYVTVFDVQGNVLMPETPLPGQSKFEGLAFLYDY
ncbi:hypothetical protein SPRG_05815 [Saprolegnia parasitica CBS 223.65]|uniref:Soluble calcium-activated nucleotidase 1 n=2 Tax=Saprolegnia parasitica (strain CBS 223.65) TaxID=695850 RepID=A0A067CQ49_SAPPC|nr:hypothetical protein SPRG_05815 [Saprolegnia parasitica CBS 223.65]KDO28942.1 hypothetical protein SPRG_05815 [Saprolegnia parasitica CBS 223.65]|eukprot:XP_012200483.1 hypothetical protein SPRG_05815 [Saprolegnia parasitica CBS 223.65]